VNKVFIKNLIEIAEKYGHSIFNDDKKLEGLLKDYCGSYKKEINLLLIAVKSGAAKELMGYNKNIPIESVLANLINLITDEYGINDKLARATINILALSLKIISIEYYNQATTKTSNNNFSHSQNIISENTINITDQGHKSKLTIANNNETFHNTRPTTYQSFKLSNGVFLEMIYIKPGSFIMGNSNSSSSEFPEHKVVLTKGYWLGKFPVTQEQYEVIANCNPSYFRKKLNPVENISWNDCQQFIIKLNKKTLSPLTFRLPTEAEWEYACRADTTSYYYWGNNMDNDYCWFQGNSRNSTHQVGLKKPNKWNLHDMSGNVWEWCEDWYSNYVIGELADPIGRMNSNLRKILRGGSWSNAPVCITSAYRSSYEISYRSNSTGFRLALS